MNTDRIIYRVRQFWDVLRTPATLDLTPAKSVLTETQMCLFSRLQPSEQAHGLRVLKATEALQERYPELTKAVSPAADLRTAALLHDIGKIRYPLRIWDRVLIVLGKQWFPNKMKQWAESQPKGWRRPFVVAAQHPSWGAALAREAGTSTLTTRLISKHQDELPAGGPISDEDKLLSILQEADNHN